MNRSSHSYILSIFLVAIGLGGIFAGPPLLADNGSKTLTPINRAEFTTLVVRAFKGEEKIGKKKNCFNDVEEEWYARFVCFAKNKKILGGYSDGSFRPGGSVSYTEALTIALSAAHIPLPEKTKDELWYEPALEFAHRNNIFSKYALLPGTPLTREKATFIIDQILLIKKGEKEIAAERQNFSSGCGKTPPRTASKNLLANGVSRHYITVIPSTYEKNTPIKLVFAFHGRTNSNTMVRGYYKVEEAAGGKAIFIYPRGLKAGRGYTWNDDFALFDALLEKFSSAYCLDLDHVYVVGHSLGGWFTSELGCVRGDVIRAIANIGGGASTNKNCAGPVAAMIWHNPKDNLVPYKQGEIARDQAKQQNQCGTKTKPIEPKWAKCVEYQGCTDGAPLLWCPHREDYAYWDRSYYPHTWPRNAGQEIWRFFEEQEAL